MHVTTAKVAPEPNVTPMIDVMLVLLCIFMIVTPTLMNGAVAEPPVAEHLKPRPQEEDDHTLLLDARGAYYLDRERITPERLGAALKRLYPAGTEDRVLFVKAHRELAYAEVRAALEVAATNGVAVVGLVTEQRQP